MTVDLLHSVVCSVLTPHPGLHALCPQVLFVHRFVWSLLLAMPHPVWEWTVLWLLFFTLSPAPSPFRPDFWTVSLFHIIIPNCIGIHISKLNLILCFYAIFLDSFPWCITFSIVVIFKQLPTWYIYHTSRGYWYYLSLTLYQNRNEDIKLTWFYSNTIETLLDTFPAPGVAIYHCFWLSCLGLFLACVTGLHKNKSTSREIFVLQCISCDIKGWPF